MRWWKVLLVAILTILLEGGCVSLEDDGRAHVRYANCDGHTRSIEGNKAVLVRCTWHHSFFGS